MAFPSGTANPNSMGRVAGFEVTGTWTTVPKNLIQTFKNSDPVLKAALKPSLKRVMTVGVHAAQTAAPRYRGRLRKSFEPGASFSTTKQNDFDVVVGTTLPYAPWLDDETRWRRAGVISGSRPDPMVTRSGQVPLRTWVKNKLHPVDDMLDYVTMKVANKIMQNGLRPRKFMEASEKAIGREMNRQYKPFMNRLTRMIVSGKSK